MRYVLPRFTVFLIISYLSTRCVFFVALSPACCSQNQRAVASALHTLSFLHLQESWVTSRKTEFLKTELHGWVKTNHQSFLYTAAHQACNIVYQASPSTSMNFITVAPANRYLRITIRKFGALMLQVVVPLTPMCHLQLCWTKPSAISFEKSWFFKGYFPSGRIHWARSQHTNRRVSAATGTGNTALSHPAPRTTKLLFVTQHQPPACSPRFCTGEHRRALEGEIPRQVSSQNTNTLTLQMITNPIVLVAKVALSTHTDNLASSVY